MLINSRPVMRTGPEVPQEAYSLPVPPLPPRPVINFTTNLRCLTTRLVRRTLLPTHTYQLSRRRAPPPALELNARVSVLLLLRALCPVQNVELSLSLVLSATESVCCHVPVCLVVWPVRQCLVNMVCVGCGRTAG